MPTPSESFVALAKVEGGHFDAVREVIDAFFAFRDAMANEQNLSRAGKEAFAAANAFADQTAVALKPIDDPEWSETEKPADWVPPEHLA